VTGIVYNGSQPSNIALRLQIPTVPAKRRYTENRNAKFKKWCKFAKGVEVKRPKTNGRKTRGTCTLNYLVLDNICEGCGFDFRWGI
jgi:hypothetical protein